MYMPAGGVCVEVEAPDPSQNYYDHASTLEELADVYGHTFYRSMHPDDDQQGVLPQLVIGDLEDCKAACLGPVRLRAFAQPGQWRRRRTRGARCATCSRSRRCA